jgi:uncharacterized Zn finger protein
MAWYAKKKGKSSSYWGYSSSPKPKIEEGSGVRGGGKYGLTWWGKAWLEAFTEISDDNRLPRGRTYANNGSVRSLTVADNKVLAEVQGSNLYKVSIEIPKFTDTEKRKITDLVNDDPLLLSGLLNKTLPQELSIACVQNGIDLFPRNWRSFKSSCSCPDYASPCKHLAAALYLVANEIDRNPFLVFDLHGFDIKNAFQSGSASDRSQMDNLHKIKSLHDTLVPRDKWEQPEVEIPMELIAQFDFSHIRPKAHLQTSRLLTDNPIFWPKHNFKERLVKDLESLTRKTGSWVSDSADEKGNSDYDNAEIIEITCDALGKPTAMRVWDCDHKEIVNTTSLSTFSRWLQGVPAGRLAKLPPDLACVFLAYSFARTLVAQGAIVPEVVQHGDTYTIRWLPALVLREVTDVYEKFTKLVSAGVLDYEFEGKNYLPNETDAPLALLSVFIQAEVERVVIPAKEYDNKILQFFFDGKAQKFDKSEERGYPEAIQVWLSRLFLTQNEYLPIFQVQAKGEAQWAIDLVFETRNDVNKVPISLKTIFAPTWKGNKMQVLSDLTILCEYFPRLRQIVQSKGAQALVIDQKEFSQLISEIVPVLEMFGVRFSLPRELRKLLRPQVSLALRESSASTKATTSGILDLASVMAYDWRISLGEHQLTESEFKALLKTGTGLVKYKDEYIFIDPKQTEALLERLLQPAKLADHTLLQIALSGEYEGAPVALTVELQKRMAELTKVDLLPLPKTLTATLRPYQHRGYSWLCKNMQLGLGSILADDMGLGKTV